MIYYHFEFIISIFKSDPMSLHLLGGEKTKDNGRSRDSRLWRRFSQVEKLPPPKRKQIVQILDAFLGSEKLKKG